MSTIADNNEIPFGSKLVETVFLCVVIAISVVGNTSLWIAVLKSRSLRTVTNMFILCLSASDLLVAIVNMPLTVFTIIKGNWIFSENLCKVVGYINMLTLVGSVLSLCNISVNRFFMVCHHGKFRYIYTTRNAVLMIIATFACTILLSSPPLFGWSEYIYTPTHSFCFADWINSNSYAYFMVCCCFGIPLCVMAFCNISIIKSVRESRRKVRTTNTAGISSTMNNFNKDEPNRDPKLNDDNPADKRQLNATALEKGAYVARPNIKSGEEIASDKFISEENVNVAVKVKNTENDKAINCTQISVSDGNSKESSAILIDHPSAHHLRMNSTYSNESQEKLKSTCKTGCLELNQTNNEKFLHPHRTNTASGLKTTVKNDSDLNSEFQTSKESKSALSKSQNNSRRREEIRLAISLIIVVVLFVICWLPYCISMLLSIHHDEPVPREFHMFTLCIGYANSAFNPIVYGVMNQRFKEGFKKLFCFWKTYVFTLGNSS